MRITLAVRVDLEDPLRIPRDRSVVPQETRVTVAGVRLVQYFELRKICRQGGEYAETRIGRAIINGTQDEIPTGRSKDGNPFLDDMSQGSLFVVHRQDNEQGRRLR